MNELIERCLSLTKGERRHMIKILNDSLMEVSDDGKARFEQLTRIVNEALKENILRKTKEHKAVVGRWIVAYQMKKEGFTYSCIGRHMKKSHSTIIYMIKMMEDIFNYPQYFKLEQAYWIEYKRRYNEFHEGTTQGS